MSTSEIPTVIQSVGLACVPIDCMPGPMLARKPVAAAIVTLHMRDDGHRDVAIECVSDARDLEFPLPVLVERALIGCAPVVITQSDCAVLAIEAAARRFFVEPKLGALAAGQGLIDPVAMLGAGQDEGALCRRLGIPASTTPDGDVARWWRRDAPAAAEGVALTNAVSRLMLWAHCASFTRGMPDAFFETLLPLREHLLDIEDQRPEIRALLRCKPFARAASFARYYTDYHARRDAGDEGACWATFEDGLSYV